MGDKGWVGAPLVKFDDCLLSGSHRYAASEYLGIDVPVVDLFDVFSLDEASVLELVQGMDSWQAEVTYLAFEANAELARELGMDIH
jgi:ParB-like chromosome segregation protein Spo0J